MKSSVEFFVAFLIVAWGLVLGLEISRVVFLVQNMHAYRDGAVYAIEHQNGVDDTLLNRIKSNAVCETCTLETQTQNDRVLVQISVPFQIRSIGFEAQLNTEGTAYLGK